MKDLISRLVREPNLILGVVVSGLSLLVLFGVNLSADQMAGIGVFLGAVIALVRFLTTPSSEVVVQEKLNGDVVAGARIPEFKGEKVTVGVSLANPDAPNPPLPPESFPPNPDHHG